MSARETNTTDPAAGGEHDRVRYVAMLYSLLQAGRSGVLEIESGPRWRRLYLIGGQPAWYESNLDDEGLAKTLVSLGLLSRRQLNWIQGKLSEGEKLETGLVAAGTLSADDVDNALRTQLERGYAAALSWSSGSWRFTPCDALRPDRIDPTLCREVNPLRALWEGVRLHVQMDDALATVTDQEAGAVQLTDGFAEQFERLEVEDALTELPIAASGEPSVEELFKRIPDRSGNLAKLLWLLQTVELIRREGGGSSPLAEAQAWLEALPQSLEEVQWLDEDAGDTDGDLGDTADDLLGDAEDEISIGDPVRVTTVEVTEGEPSAGEGKGKAKGKARTTSSRKKPKAPVRTPEEYADLLRNAHRHRMGKDYYAFLGVAPTAPLAEIKKAYGRLAKRCKKARATDGLAEDARELAKEMLNAARRVWLTLSDDTLRAAYNRRLDAGDAPVVRARERDATVRLRDPVPAPRSGPEAPPVTAYDQAKILMSNGDHERARKLLERARRESPSSPDVLADLGWCTWMVQGRTTGDASEAEEFLRLAVAFDPRHTSALEFLARITVERGDTDNARQRVKALLRVVPSSGWGNQALQGLGREPDADAGSSGRLRFWKKKR
ncbi:MAG: tetratricopeptide repeat protein [Myxococcota bacterium]|nr:tetratricopeptide repeat protein [Myxococcota bacterium]